MPSRRQLGLASLVLALGACTGQFSRSEGTDTDGGGPVIDLDLGPARDFGGAPPPDLGGMPPPDLGGMPPRDLGGMPPIDMGRPPVDMGRPPVDMGGPPPPVDLGMPAACSGGPLAAPIPGCMPTPVPDTGDPHADCVTRINQFRLVCQCLPPLARWVDGEACADMNASYDAMRMTPHAGFSAGICGSGYGQNECPGWLGWGSIPSTISSCLQDMWDEGPGTPFSEHGHYLNMSSSRFTMVACGFYTSGGQVTAVQNFQ